MHYPFLPRGWIHPSRDVRYNCRVFVLNGKVLLIRPKQFLASDGNYREERWFSQWKHKRTVEDFLLPQCIRVITGTCRARLMPPHACGACAHVWRRADPLF